MSQLKLFLNLQVRSLASERCWVAGPGLRVDLEQGGAGGGGGLWSSSHFAVLGKEGLWGKMENVSIPLQANLISFSS